TQTPEDYDLLFLFIAQTLLTCGGWVRQHHNLIFIGPTGIGKSVGGLAVRGLAIQTRGRVIDFLPRVRAVIIHPEVSPRLLFGPFEPYGPAGELRKHGV